jgi:hypothetical protein
MTTASAQASANIAFIKFTLAKLGRTNRKVCFGTGNIASESAFCRGTKTKQIA